MNNNFKFKLLHITLLVIYSQSVSAEQDASAITEFDPQFFSGQQINMERFSHPGGITPGVYNLTININGEYIGSAPVQIDSGEAVNENIVCANPKLIELINSKIKAKIDTSKGIDGCVSLKKLISYIDYSIDMPNLSIEINIPQIFLNIRSRGYTNPSSWDEGINAGFVNYNMNYNESQQSGSSRSSFFSMLQSGINIGLWQFRNNTNYNYNQGHSGKWNVINSYVQRPIAAIQSNLVLGEYNSDGRYLESVNFKGMKLSSDDRMLPESQQGFAPVVRGIAQSNSTVEIRQRGILLYQTVVSQGPFVIDDLYPTGYGGELDVTVTGADGQVQKYSVPFSSVSQLLRAGMSRYDVTVGELNNSALHDKPKFAQAWYSRGMSNIVTAYAGGLLSKNYQATVTGLAVNTPIGALGFDVTNSFAKINDNQDSKNGWSIKASHSKLLESTRTYFALSTYRYSSEDYYDFNSASLANEKPNSSNYNRKSKLEVSINQPINDNGTLFLSGSQVSYWNKNDRSTYYQAGYGFTYRDVSFGLSASRVENDSSKNENLYSLSMSIPFRTGDSGYNNITSSFNTSGSGHSQTTLGVNGLVSQESNLSYGLSSSYERDSGSSVAGSLTKNYSQGQASLMASSGKHYSQYSAGLSGSVVAHSGGITLGQYAPNGLVLIEAENATGAEVYNSSGIAIDRFGYAILPYASAYRVNDVSINPEGIPENTELKNTSKNVIPYSGAVVKVNFQTVVGYKAFIYSQQQNGQELPIGSVVSNEKGEEIGLVGQSSTIYATGLADKGLLKVSWGAAANENCTMKYDIDALTEQEVNHGLYKLSLTCMK